MGIFDEIEELALLASLTESKCELPHGPDDDNEYKAVDYIAQSMGYDEGNGVERVVDRLIIPVCADCAEALSGNDWVLLYCMGCNSSQWVLRKLAKLKYDRSLVWMDKCQNC